MVVGKQPHSVLDSEAAQEFPHGCTELPAEDSGHMGWMYSYFCGDFVQAKPLLEIRPKVIFRSVDPSPAAFSSGRPGNPRQCGEQLESQPVQRKR